MLAERERMEAATATAERMLDNFVLLKGYVGGSSLIAFSQGHIAFLPCRRILLKREKI
jgi:hypothetical protein